MSGPGREFRRMTIDASLRCATAAATTRDLSSATVHNELTARRSTAARSANHFLTMGLSTTDGGSGGNRRGSSVIRGASIDTTPLSERAQFRAEAYGAGRAGLRCSRRCRGASAPALRETALTVREPWTCIVCGLTFELTCALRQAAHGPE